MTLEQFYEKNNPWPDRSNQKVLFILDARNSLEEEMLRKWIGSHSDPSASFDAPQVCIDLKDEKTGFDSGQLVMSLALPPETIIAPLRVAWSSGDNRGRLRYLILRDPRKPSPRQGQKILSEHPERVTLMAGAPDTMANLRQRFEDQHSDERAASQSEFANFVARQAALVLDMEERKLKGGRYKMPRHVAATLMASAEYNADLEQLAKDSGRPKDELMKEAAEYMKEMVSAPSSFWIDFYARFNNYCLGLGYEEDIVYDRVALKKIRHMVRNNPSMLLWTHKTYLDGMVVPKVMYDNDFPMPHMFGGANLNFPGLGYLLHRAGAIFIKRSFQDNEVYKITLRHYIGYLMEKRFPMNWAFEGTRSRMGKLMPPRYGLLKYVLEACHHTGAENIHIIPVSISYDIIRDVEEYATEQTGRGKGAESLKWFIGYVRSLARPMGKVYMDIGEPVVLKKAPDPDDRLALSKIAFEVAVEANEVTPITLPSLVTMSLLGAAPKALTETELVEDLNALLQWAESRQLRISPDFDRDFADQMEGPLGIMLKENIVTRYDEGPEVVYGIGLEQHPVASYYRNTVIHFFVNKAIIELALVKASENQEGEAVSVFWNEVDQLRDLFKFEFFYAPTEEFHQQIRDELAHYSDDWETLLNQGAAGFGTLLQNMAPLVAHVTLLTYAEAYSVVAAMLARKEAHESVEQAECIADALTYGRQAYLQRRISSESSIGKLLFKNAYKMLQGRELTEGGPDSLKERRVELSRELRELLRRIDVIRAIGVASRGAS
ncbi:glycerol-3-phosphate 1-O-acyltransferase [Halioglobus maricola]|uniref:Glycerol-3-phosphate acyltransferase n=1 Tax=Halioglobus maricola TaxID=2601894 RepID=A0A5P9NP65_9GAMM|nr:glycerol-3-phosphate 1-O-acyltransferase [Halioglobus maricola]QFU77286.1 glycerol-3-phosphate 1-O-acyltransferase [Halioglobus maricola]